MKYYITKYALTRGIQERDGNFKITEKSLILTDKFGRYGGQHRKPDWHLTVEDANRQAETMRLKEIGRLKRKIAQLEALKFA